MERRNRGEHIASFFPLQNTQHNTDRFLFFFDRTQTPTPKHSNKQQQKQRAYKPKQQKQRVKQRWRDKRLSPELRLRRVQRLLPLRLVEVREVGRREGGAPR